MSLLIRRMTLEDVPSVHVIDVLSFSLPWPERSYRFEVAENPAARCWVVESGDRLAAMLVLWLLVDEAHIATIATHPDFRRQHIADGLLVASLVAARKEGAKKAFLEVRAGNQPALALYQKYGFYQAGIRPKYYKDNNEDAILMNLDDLQSLEAA